MRLDTKQHLEKAHLHALKCVRGAWPPVTDQTLQMRYNMGFKQEDKQFALDKGGSWMSNCLHGAAWPDIALLAAWHSCLGLFRDLMCIPPPPPGAAPIPW